MPHLTAKELKTADPKRFQTEYSKWAEHPADYDWWKWAEEQLKERLSPAGVTVDRICFRLSYSQGDYATFEGRIALSQWMESIKDDGQTYAEKYPALYLAACEYGEFAKVTTGHCSCNASVNLDGALLGNVMPSGIFSALESDAWDELVEAQYTAAGIEQAMQDYVGDISRRLYGDLQSEYEHLTSEESFIESCESNDVTFEIEECES